MESILSVLNDEKCRTIMRQLDEPKTADTLSRSCEYSSSTLYRKLEKLLDTGLVERQFVVRSDYSHTSKYVLTFDEISISIDDIRTSVVSADE